MFPRVVSTKKNGEEYKYLYLIESYRENGQVRQRVVGNLGNVNRYSEQEVRRIIQKLSEFLSEPLGSAEDIKNLGVRHYGDVLAANALWEELGLTQAIKSRLADRKTGFDVSLYLKLMVFNRLLEPRSKLGVSQWYHRVFLPEVIGKELDVHCFYRAMDYLEEMKDDLERYLYRQLTDLFNLKLNLVFYDLTSSYFEGSKCQLARFGYSRDHRPDKKQILLGLLVTNEGLPIAHKVFCGNRADKTTVVEVISELKSKFKLQRCIFVGDRGLVSPDNIKALEEAGFEYIIAMRKRRSKEVLRVIDPELRNYSVTEDGLLVKETYVEGTRYIICRNPEKAKEDAEFRQKSLEQAKEGFERIKKAVESGRLKKDKAIIKRAIRTQLQKDQRQYFDFDLDAEGNFRFWARPERLAEEELLDGLFVLRTNVVTLAPAELVRGYKSLAEVEDAFRVIKDFIKLRPIYHYSEVRVRAHVFLCVLAYLLEKLLEHKLELQASKYLAQAQRMPEGQAREKLKARALRLTGRRALDCLRDLQAVEQEILNRRVFGVVQPNSTQRLILEAVGVSNIPKVIPI